MRTTVGIYGVDLDVDFTYTPPYRGARDTCGAPLEPDEQEEVCVETVWHKGEDITALIGGDHYQIIEKIILGSLHDEP